ncbi:hypothetical protein Tco_0652592 [Tanacetum coccineum]|uniref:Uncharacterized protein n=1 Tax=Tanacetum coccineum TaxID=301880 RepID=A0ABQ4WXZ3_9ASTR
MNLKGVRRRLSKPQKKGKQIGGEQDSTKYPSGHKLIKLILKRFVLRKGALSSTVHWNKKKGPPVRHLNTESWQNCRADTKDADDISKQDEGKTQIWRTLTSSHSKVDRPYVDLSREFQNAIVRPATTWNRLDHSPTISRTRTIIWGVCSDGEHGKEESYCKVILEEQAVNLVKSLSHEQCLSRSGLSCDSARHLASLTGGLEEGFIFNKNTPVMSCLMRELITKDIQDLGKGFSKKESSSKCCAEDLLLLTYQDKVKHLPDSKTSCLTSGYGQHVDRNMVISKSCKWEAYARDSYKSSLSTGEEMIKEADRVNELSLKFSDEGR